MPHPETKKKSKILGACLSSKYLTVNRVGNLPLKQGKAHCTSDNSNQSESDNVSKVGEVAAAMGVSRSVPARSSIINSLISHVGITNSK